MLGLKALVKITCFNIGFGEVRRGKWLGNQVAIKKYGRKARTKEKVQEDFLKEVDVIGALRHPNILLFMGAYLDTSGAYLITEYNCQISKN